MRSNKRKLTALDQKEGQTPVTDKTSSLFIYTSYTRVCTVSQGSLTLGPVAPYPAKAQQSLLPCPATGLHSHCSNPNLARAQLPLVDTSSCRNTTHLTWRHNDPPLVYKKCGSSTIDNTEIMTVTLLTLWLILVILVTDRPLTFPDFFFMQGGGDYMSCPCCVPVLVLMHEQQYRIVPLPTVSEPRKCTMLEVWY